MKRKLFLLITVCALLLLILPACDAQEAGSLKSITKPYIAQYECTEAYIGSENLLDKFEYIEIVLTDKENMELIYMPKDGEKHKVESTYTLNPETHELTAEIGIYGYRFKETTIVEHGEFTIRKNIGIKTLIMKFKAK